MIERDDDDEEQTLRYAEAYRKRLEGKINAVVSFGEGEAAGTVRAPEWLRQIRAQNIWRRIMSKSAPPEWTVEDIITALVVWAFGRPTQGNREDDYDR
jgi:hypothetical protein